MKGDGRWHSKCIKTNQLEHSVPNGQDILEKDVRTGLFYNCFNRADEDPFKKNTHSWSDWMMTPCEGDSRQNRRCLGQNPSQCVNVYGEYI